MVPQLQQLRLCAVKVHSVAVLYDGLALEERGHGGEVLVAQQDGLRARVEEGEGAALGADGCEDMLVAVAAGLDEGGRW